MRIDLTDLERTDGIAEALGRLFWCLVAVAFVATILGSAGTGLLLLIFAAASFVVRVGLEDFARTQRGREERVAARESGITIHRTERGGGSASSGSPTLRASGDRKHRPGATSLARPTTKLGAR